MLEYQETRSLFMALAFLGLALPAAAAFCALMGPLSGCSSSTESRVLFLEADSGSVTDSVTEGGAMPDVGQPEGSSGFDSGVFETGGPDRTPPGVGESGTCTPEGCTNTCLISAPFRCCMPDGRCGCSWMTVEPTGCSATSQ